MAVALPKLYVLLKKDTLDQWRDKTNILKDYTEKLSTQNIGDTLKLATTVKTVVDGINEVQARSIANKNNVGDISRINTPLKNDLVTAINSYVTAQAELIGNFNEIRTIAKNNIVDSINELVAISGHTSVNLRTVSKNLVSAINELDREVGNVSTLNTSNRNDLVNALNEVNTKVGLSLFELKTSNKSNIVNSINEVQLELQTVDSIIAQLRKEMGYERNLDSRISSNTLVGAINELQRDVGSIGALVTSAKSLVGAVNELHFFERNTDSTKYWLSGKQFGIGKTPSYPLDVNGDANFDGTVISEKVKTTTVEATTVSAPILTGNASTATKMKTPRSITLTGDATGSGTFDGSTNLSITVAVRTDPENFTVRNVLRARKIEVDELSAGNISLRAPFTFPSVTIRESLSVKDLVTTGSVVIEGNNIRFTTSRQGSSNWDGIKYDDGRQFNTGGVFRFLADTPYDSNGTAAIDVGALAVRNSEVIDTDGKIDAGRIKNIPASWTVSDWTKLTNRPTTRDGYGLKDVYTKAECDNRFVTKTELNNMMAPVVIDLTGYNRTFTAHRISYWNMNDSNYRDKIINLAKQFYSPGTYWGVRTVTVKFIIWSQYSNNGFYEFQQTATFNATTDWNGNTTWNMVSWSG